MSPPLPVPAQVADGAALPILEGQTPEADLCPTARISLWFYLPGLCGTCRGMLESRGTGDLSLAPAQHASPVEAPQK